MTNEIKNIDKAADHIKFAVKTSERIILYGDSDLDGVASVVILEETIKNLGGQVAFSVFPNREEDGYGVNLKALEFLKEKSPALFITLDLGITNIKEINIANSYNFEVMIIDHHQQQETLPNAKIIVNPQLRSQGDRESPMPILSSILDSNKVEDSRQSRSKVGMKSGQKEDDSDFKYLCNAGLTFKLAEEILGDNFSESLCNSFLELVALATISDMVPQIKDNKIFIEKGLRSLKNTFRPGLRAFLDILGEGEVVAGGYLKIISALNAAESVDFKNDSYILLTNFLLENCLKIAQTLIDKTNFKQQKIKEAVLEVERRILGEVTESIIFEGDPAWKLTLAGSIASILANKYQKPIFIYKKMDKESCGSVRSPKDTQNSVEAMAFCKDLLITYGGHPKASGFRIKNENLEAFKKCLIEYFKK